MALYELYKGAFEQKCFQLLIDAYQTSLKEKVIQLDWNENDISHELIEKIDNNRLRLRWNILVTREYYLTKDIEKVKGFADRLPRIDFRLTTIFAKAEKEFKYYCEAKRLKEKDSHLKREYIKEGIDRYVSKKYPLGCMIGYLLEGKADETIIGINSLLHKDKRNSEKLNLKPNELLKTYYESNHPDIGNLKHFIFDFTSVS